MLRALVFGLAIGLLVPLAVVLAPPGDAAPRRLVGGWIPYWATASALQSFKANADLFGDVSPFWHSLTSDTTVSDQETSADRALVISAARAAGVPVVPAVTDGTGTRNLAAALADPARRATVVQTLVSLVASRGYDGLDLDLEGFAYSDGRATWAATRPNWVSFVADLGAQLHARGKVLFATIPPTYDSNRGSRSGYWVYDYAGIAPHVDKVRIMAYDYSVSSPGPIAPYAWVKQIAAYAVTQVPSGKVVLGIPTYGRDWVTAVTGTCPAGTDVSRASLTASAAWQLAAAKGASVQWDAAARERTFTYANTFEDPGTSCTVARKVYFSDASAVIERSRLLDTYLLGGVAFWSVGDEDAQQWALLRIMAANPWDPRVAPLEDLKAFVSRGYRDVLGREADPGGLQGWTDALRSGAISRTGFMYGLIYSPEGASRTAAALYSGILGRAPDPGGLSGWASAIAQQRVKVKDARVGFWVSPERLAKSGPLQRWIMDIYSVELGRAADPGGLAYWTQVGQTQGALAVARGVIGSQEWAQRQVGLQYQLMLQRTADPGGLAGWTSVLLQSDLPIVQASLGGSDEYFARPK